MLEPNTTEPQKTQESVPSFDSSLADTAEQEVAEADAILNDADEKIEEQGAEDKPARPLALLLEYLELFVTCLCTILILFSFFFRICSVSGHSMNPTLKDGELLLVSDFFYDPTPGDIIIFHQTSDEASRFNEPIVKRVIATEGQTVYIDFTDAIVKVDGVCLEEDYIQLTDERGIPIGAYDSFADHNFRQEPQADGKTHYIFEATVPEGSLFVMGDNRNNSSDSRVKVIGFVDERRVLGRVLYRISAQKGLIAAD